METKLNFPCSEISEVHELKRKKFSKYLHTAMS